jgi:transcriptional regulator with GAF, ATPase, and Fis domain
MLYTDDQDRLWVRRCRVKVNTGEAKGQSCELAERSIWIGTAPDNDLVVPDKTVSRRHVELQLREEGIFLRDLGSTNGTFFEGARIKEIFIPAGSAFRMGQSELQVVSADERVDLKPAGASRFEGLIGVSTRMREIFELLSRVAPTEATVLIEGETGTGKEIIAEAIHKRSSRRGGPFQIFDGGATPANLIESELFGHVKGAFTGATNTRRGAFECATAGTLFLDEIGELTLDLQPKLLRVLESRTVRRVGGDDTHKVDVRIIAATNRNLRDEVKAGRFRADLFYRLAVVRLVVPPLRDRAEDMPLLVEHFLDGSPKKPTAEAMGILERYSWPGNVRELRNVVDRAKAFGWQNALDECGLSASTRSQRDYTAPPSSEGGVFDPDSPVERFKEAKGKIVDQFERDYLVDLMKRAKGNVSQAAREAGLDRNHLAQLLKKHNIGGK